MYIPVLYTSVVCHLILRYTTADLQEKKNTLRLCFVYPNTLRGQFPNSVFTDDSRLLSLWVCGYGRFQCLQCLYRPQSNCPLKLKSPRSFWNIRNRQSPNGTPTHPRSVNPQENCCENWRLHIGRQHLSLSSNDVVRSTPNCSSSISLYFVVWNW